MSDVQEIGDEQPRKRKRAASGEEANAGVSPIAELPLAATIEAIREHQRRRVFAITAQMASNQRTQQFLAGPLGYRGPETPKAERKRIFALADDIRIGIERVAAAEDKLRQAVAAGKNDLGSLERKIVKEREKLAEIGHTDVVRAVWDIVVTSWVSRIVWDKTRDESEAEMAALAETLPGAAWFQSIQGVTLHGLAVIVAEAGDLGGYSNPGKLWKRFGAAPYKGKALSSWRRGGGLSKEEWASPETGYKPARLGQFHGVVLGPLIMRKAKNPYGKVYDDRRTYEMAKNANCDYAARAADELHKLGAKKGSAATRATLGAGRLTAKHIQNRVTRYTGKRLLLDLWRAWRREARARLEPRITVPPANSSESPAGDHIQFDTHVAYAAEPGDPKRAKRKPVARRKAAE